MATSFLNSSDKIWFQEAVATWFETFKKNITVHKEPIKILENNTSKQLLGYKDYSNLNSYSYNTRNQVFEAVIKYNDNNNLIEDQEIKINITDQIVQIYVKEDAKNYIDSGKTIKITFDNKTFNIFSTSIVKTYGDLNYYMYYLKETR